MDMVRGTSAIVEATAHEPTTSVHVIHCHTQPVFVSGAWSNADMFVIALLNHSHLVSS